MQNKPTVFNRGHIKDFEDAIIKYILPFHYEKAEELMEHIYDIYEQIGYPTRLGKGPSFLDLPTQKLP